MQCQDQPHNQKEGAVELIDMQKAFVELAQGAWEGIARTLNFDKKRLQKTALQREFAPASEGEARRNATRVGSLLTERAHGDDQTFKARAVLARRAQWNQSRVPFLRGGNERAWEDLLNGRVPRQVVSRLIRRSSATILTERLEGEITIGDSSSQRVVG